MKAELRIPLDPTNPGQFYACCGLVELFDFLGHDVLSRFELNPKRPKLAEFAVTEASEKDLAHVLGQVVDARYETLTDTRAETSVLPVRAELESGAIELDWWLDEFRMEATVLKCWAGQVTSGRLFKELPPLIDSEASPVQLFHAARASKSKFGVDPRSAWNALDFGYSPNEQGQDAATFPAVEMLAAFGLQGFRPFPSRDRRAHYSLWLEDLPRIAAIQASLAPWDGANVAAFEFEIAKRGQSYKYFTPATPVLKGTS
jgi:hypothetical protein